MSVLVRAERVTVERGGVHVVRDVDLEVSSGELVALLGPNGAGKSTLLAALSGDLTPVSGRVVVDGEPVGSWSAGDLARVRAVLLQRVTVSFPFTVRQIVAMGRAPWVGTPAEEDDERRVAETMAECDVAHLADRQFTRLSGGERARVALARVLAQDTPVLLLDEPTAALDLHHQELVLASVRHRARSGGAVVVVLHDLTLAAAWADRVVLLAQGRTAAAGAPGEVLTGPVLSEVYGCPVEVFPHPRTGAPIVLPVRD